MSEIIHPNNAFDFTKITMLSPTIIPGGNYFIKFKQNDYPLYIQTPTCKTKQGFIKSGKRMYCDLMFTNENEEFIHWIENLENYCKTLILQNKTKWFETELDEHDIENSFTSSLKIFKSGKYYICRTNVPTVLGICNLKIYNENETAINMETIQENTNVLSILEIQGIKCSARNFQIEIEIKQMMVIEPKNLFEKCILKKSSVPHTNANTNTNTHTHTNTNTSYEEPQLFSLSMSTVQQVSERDPLEEEQEEELEKEKEKINESDEYENKKEKEMEEDNSKYNTLDNNPNITNVEPFVTEDLPEESTPNAEPEPDHMKHPVIELSNNDIIEIELPLEEIPYDETISIKQRNDIYYKIYKEAKRKAKMARDLALASYLEAKRIKNTYLLENINDSESDLDEETFEK